MASTVDADDETYVLARVINWPVERDRLLAARRTGVPRLVLVDPAAVPPDASDVLEDWVRMPATRDDIRRRVEALEQRAIDHLEPPPIVDDDGVLHFHGLIVVLTPIEHRLAVLLIGRYRTVVTRSELFRAGWPGGDPNLNSLDAHLVRLRRRMADVGLRLRTVRQRGYLVDADTPGSARATR